VRQLRAEYIAAAKEKLSYLTEIFKIGVPAGLQFFFEVAAFNAAQFMAGWLGIKFASSHQIALNLASITFMMLTGISIAGNILTGYAYGAKDRRGIIVAGNTVFMITLVMESFFAILFLSLRHVLPMLYTDDTEVISIASSMLVFAALFQISDGFQSVASGALRGVQDVTIPSIMAFVCYWIIMVPLSYLLAFKYQLGLQGIWIGFIVGLTLAAVTLLIRFRWVSKRIEFKEI
jgi:MATE family multidrug resistance protein